MEFSRQEYWSGLPFPSPGDLPDPGIKPRSPILQADSLPSELPGKPMQDRKGLKLEGEGGRLGKGRCWSRKQHQLCFFPWKPRGDFKPRRAPQTMETAQGMPPSGAWKGGGGKAGTQPSSLGHSATG